jgi:hypothetical protein
MGVLQGVTLAFRQLKPIFWNDECRLDGATPVADGEGGYTHRWDASAGFPCNVITGNNATQAGNQGLVPLIGEETAVTVELPYEMGVDAGGRLVIAAADRIVSGNQTFEVVHIAPPGGKDTIVTAYCVVRT